MTNNTFIPAPPAGAWLVTFEPGEEPADNTHLILGWDMPTEDEAGSPIVVTGRGNSDRFTWEVYDWQVIYGNEHVQEAAQRFWDATQRRFDASIARHKMAYRDRLREHSRVDVGGIFAAKRADECMAVLELVEEGAAAWGSRTKRTFIVPTKAGTDD